MEQINPAGRLSSAGRLQAAVPSRREILLGTPLWGALMTVSMLSTLYMRNGLLTSHLSSLVVVYFAGGMIGWTFALPAARYLAHHRPVETRFAAFFLALSSATLAATAFLFAMDYRWFYARWHAPFGTITWMFQFVFTSASATYQFAILGFGLFLPLGLACLAIVSLRLAKASR